MPAKQNLSAEAQAVKEFYSALNRGDIPAVMALFHSEAVRIEPANFPMEGTYRGQAEIRAHIEKARATWAEGGCEPEQLIVTGDKVVALVHVRVRLKNKTTWNEGDTGDVFTFRDGKLTEMRTFFEQRLALDWAGVKAQT